jgi:hypothetical protein
MKTHLLGCPACERHVRADERACPFCSATLPPSFGATEYLRGKKPGEITRDLTKALVSAGVSRKAVAAASSETAAIEAALRVARRGDVVVVAPHVDRAAVAAWAAKRRPTLEAV